MPTLTRDMRRGAANKTIQVITRVSYKNDAMELKISGVLYRSTVKELKDVCPGPKHATFIKTCIPYFQFSLDQTIRGTSDTVIKTRFLRITDQRVRAGVAAYR